MRSHTYAPTRHSRISSRSPNRPDRKKQKEPCTQAAGREGSSRCMWLQGTFPGACRRRCRHARSNRTPPRPCAARADPAHQLHEDAGGLKELDHVGAGFSAAPARGSTLSAERRLACSVGDQDDSHERSRGVRANKNGAHGKWGGNGLPHCPAPSLKLRLLPSEHQQTFQGLQQASPPSFARALVGLPDPRPDSRLRPARSPLGALHEASGARALGPCNLGGPVPRGSAARRPAAAEPPPSPASLHAGPVLMSASLRGGLARPVPTGTTLFTHAQVVATFNQVRRRAGGGQCWCLRRPEHRPAARADRCRLARSPLPHPLPAPGSG